MSQKRTRLTNPVILAWADAYHAVNGFWPTILCGPLEGIPGGEGESWSAIDNSLTEGRRGLRGGITLSQLLQKHRGLDPQRNRPRPILPRPSFTIAQVLGWVDAYVERYGFWPSVVSGSVDPVSNHPETWRAVDEALRFGRRGLLGGSTLQEFLQQHRGKLARARKPFPSVTKTLSLIQREHKRTGNFPRRSDVPVPGYPDLNWIAIDTMLRQRGDGFRPHTTLAMLKADHFGFRNHMRLPPLAVKQVLAWVDAHHRRHGRWPICKGTYKHKDVEEAPGEQWPMISRALRKGLRGLPAVGGLPELLMEHRGVRNKSRLQPLNIKQVLAWADAHHKRTGSWPHGNSGPIRDAPPPGETWQNVDAVLVAGHRGLPRRMSVTKLLVKHRGIRHPMHPPRLMIKQILGWADAHYQRTGDWPSRSSGRISEEPAEKWSTVHLALVRGTRGLRGRSTLTKLLAEHRMPVYARKGIPLKRSEILDWAEAHHELTGKLPTPASGPVRDAPGETWAAIDASLRTGSRGLRGTVSLVDFLTQHYTPAHRHVGGRLSTARIIAWAESFKQRVGRWPTRKSAYTDSSRTDSWTTIDIALREGLRGLPASSSLAKLLREHRRR